MLWQHQQNTLDDIDACIEQGEQLLLVGMPTGGGKTRCMVELLMRGKSTILYTHRRFLREQIQGVVEGAGIDFGVRASGERPALLRDVQISSLQTEESRVFKRKQWDLHNAELVLIDEAHVQKGKVAEKVIEAHIADGATVIGFTATPLDLGHIYKKLIVGAVNSELRECGAHVICQSYGPDEPDTRQIKPTATGEYTEGDVRKVIMTPTIFGRVFQWWQVLNPDARPAILFAPGVPESMYFAEEFYRKGVPAAHIDGDEIWMNGERMPSTQEARNELAEASRTGAVKVVCNRFVMREGIDWPWLYHGIMATVFGSVSSYLQSGGRLLRSHPSLDHVILQDHGGNWHRHGSLNADREWRLEYTAAMVSGVRQERMREKKEREPITCPECSLIRMAGPSCPGCGHTSNRRTRKVMQIDGQLVEHEGEIYKPRKIRQKPDTEALWLKCYHRAKRSRNGMTFNQAYGLFVYENRYSPPRNLPLMPIDDTDWFRKVKHVSTSNLIGKENSVA
jgi:superfamily II DNA or RNA helicase